MFEKDENYRKARKESKDEITKVIKVWSAREETLHDTGFQKGAEFGYNKANEWHYPSKGEYPKGKGAVLIYWKFGDKKCASVVEPYKVTEDKHIIAWKEIALP